MTQSTDHASTVSTDRTGTAQASASSTQRNAALALLLATVFWGCGFTWAKMGGEAIHRAVNLPDHSTFGPVFLLACRFTLGGVIWMLLFPAARKGWTWLGVIRTVSVGIMLGISLVVQHLGLDRTTEAVSAFLTSLTILFVPLLMTFMLAKPPRALLWLGVAVATLGVWTMTAGTPTGFGRGEFMGLTCAFGFSLYILAVNAVAVHETPWRSTGGQFLTVGAFCFITCALTKNGAHHLTATSMAHILAHTKVWENALLMAIFPTIASFGLLTHFQPRLDPTRAALIYLVEPVVAAIFAALQVHHIPDWRVAAGAFLILVANVLVEMLSSRQARAEAPIVME
jgi:drug/metabolite transporter (DMT)-like permease